ncbi:glycosyltransferase 87 family protein [Thermoplasma sp. Kam2015]|uniref:glycosyltransferase 87 family protein n=1 Tax=Thermoplasma sp. Kam2015 TaxID=2094122 RepID=UPI000DA117A5|nr:glycosyltransferase family 87 protein [Thermoplasma sp. Kam2015]
MNDDDLWSTVRRIEYLGFTVIAYMIAYYLWTVYGYLDLYIDLLQWTLSIAGIFVAIYALTGHSMKISRRTVYILLAGNSALILTIILRFGFLDITFDPVILFLAFVDYYLVHDMVTEKHGNPRKFAYIFAIVTVSLLSVISAAMYSNYVAATIAVVLIALSILSYFRFSALIYMAIVGSVIFLALSILPLYPRFGTDELALDYYAALMILHGMNPYSAHVMSGAFKSLHFPLYMTTPMATGGYVENFSYPVLAAIMFMPSVIMHFPPTLVILSFTIAIYLMVAIYFFRRKMVVSSILSIAILAVNINIINFADGSVPDAAWAAFLTASIMLIEKPRYSALLYGLSTSIKQIPWIILPFLLYFVYRERGIRNAVEYLLISAGVFIITNISFIISNPHSFISSILSPETAQLIGVGQGISIISIAGYYSLEPLYFTIMFVFSILFFLFIYIRHFETMKYTFLIFPLLIFFFNFRDLYNYLIFWPFMAFAFLPYLKGRNANKSFRIGLKRIMTYSMVFIAVAAIIAVPMHEHSQFSISSVSNINRTSYYVIGMNVNVSYTGEHPIPLEFRFLPYGYLGNLNGFIWSVKSYTAGSNWINFTIVPSYQQSMLNANYSYKLIAYYGEQQAFYDLNLPSMIYGE